MLYCRDPNDLCHVMLGVGDLLLFAGKITCSPCTSIIIVAISKLYFVFVLSTVYSILELASLQSDLSST